MSLRNCKWFTLVELIVVISVLAVLASISFSTIANITSSARDSARLTDISSMKTSLETYNATKGGFPIPDNAVAITWSGNLAWSQGTFGDNTARALNTISRPKDPKWGVDYSYSVSNSKKEYEVATVLEKATSFNGINKAYAQGEQYDTIIKGNYNGVALRVSSAISTWILSVPTIIASDIKDAKLENIVFAYPKSGNVPFTYTGSITSPQVIPTAWTPKQVWSGALVLPKTDSELTQLTTDLKTAYIGSPASNSETIKSLLATTDNKRYGSNVVNNVGGNIVISWNTNNGPVTITDTGGVWIKVPGNAIFSTSDFYVMKYEAKVAGGSANSSYNGHNYNSTETIISNATDVPVVNINQGDAIAACNKIGAHLVTNNEWMTMARNAEAQPSNWTTGVVGAVSSAIYSGHNENAPAYALAASATDTDEYINTGNSAPSNQRRTLTLSNGQVIWDLAGNVWEHVNKANTVDANGTGYATNTTTIGCNEWSSCTVAERQAYWPSNNTWNTTYGMGYIWNSAPANNVFLRGGSWYNGARAGVFALHLGWDASLSNNDVGFRCAK